jgi:hypothetical protein
MIPKNGSKYLVTLVYSVIFAILLHFLLYNLPVREGMSDSWNPMSIIGLTLFLLIFAVIVPLAGFGQLDTFSMILAAIVVFVLAFVAFMVKK